MSQKKEIKIRTDSEQADKKSKAAEAVDQEMPDLESESEKADNDQVDDPLTVLAEKLKSKEQLTMFDEVAADGGKIIFS